MAAIPTQDSGEAVDQDFLREAADMGAARLAGYSTYREWVDGEHQLRLTDRQRQYLQRTTVPFCENFCETVVQVRTSRLAIDGFTADTDSDTEAGSEEDAEATLADTLRDWWRKDNCQLTEKLLYEATEVEGDAFLVVSWNQAESRPRYSFNPPEQIKVVYDPDEPERMEYAVKVWNSRLEAQPIRRMNLFYPDRIEKWFTFAARGNSDESWHPLVDASDYEENTDDPSSPIPQWPIPWVNAAGEPLGIPVIHFRGQVGRDQYGRSGVRPLIPQNAALNKLVLDLFEVIDYMGWPWRYATGVDGDFDPLSSPGRFMKTTGVEAKFGQLDAADPTKLIEVITSQLRRLAARSRTPIHDLVDMGGERTGEAQKSAETPLVKLCDDRKIPLGVAVSQSQGMAIRLANVFGGMSLPEDATVEPQWCSSETRNEQAEATTAGLLHDLGVSKYTLLSELGYDPEEEAARRKAEADEAMAQQEAQLSAGLLGSGAYAPNAPTDVPTKTNQPPAKPKVPG